MHCEILAKPMGVIRIFLLVLGILSMVSLFDFKGSFEFRQICPVAESEVHQATVEWRYPFVLTSEMIPLVTCNDTIHDAEYYQIFFANFDSQAKFFSFMAGTSALVSLVWLILYISVWFHYEHNSSMATLDILMSIATAILWLCADCAWASAFTSLKAVTNIDLILHIANGYQGCQNGAECEIAGKKDEYARGGFSITVGFCICVLWFAVAILAYRERSRITIERRGIMGVTRSEAQTQANAQAQAGRYQSSRVDSATAQPDFAHTVYQ